MNSNSYDSLENMRIEIAVLQEDISAYKPCVAKFKIPTIMTKDVKTTIVTSSSNIANKRNANNYISTIDIENCIEIYVPYEYIFSYGKDIVPKGTKFIVSFIGSDINNSKIIGRYDESESKTMNGVMYDHYTDVLEIDVKDDAVRVYSDEQNERLYWRLYNEHILSLLTRIRNLEDKVDDIEDRLDEIDSTLDEIKDVIRLNHGVNIR